MNRTMHSGVLSVIRKQVMRIFLFSLLIGCAFLVNSPAHATAGINPTITFQGRLLNSQGATVPDGYYNIQFKIYQDGDGLTVGDSTGSPAGSLKWTETHLNNSSQGVMVKNGFMSVDLGSVNAFGSNVDWNQSTLWLSINIGNTNGTCTPFSSCSPDNEMVPMKRLSSTPYSLNSGQLGGIASSGFVQLAQGVQTDVSNNTSSIYLNKTGTGGNFLELQSGGSDAFLVNNTGDITLGANGDHTISVATAVASAAGKSLTVSSGTGGSGTGSAGGNLTLQGGAAGGTNANGGNVIIAGGAATGSGAKGLVNLSATAYIANTNTGCSANCTLSQSNVDNYGTVLVNASVADIRVTLPPPTNTTTAGRILYVTTNNSSQDFTLTTNSGADIIDVAMRKNTTATMIWSGTEWTAGGASNATTLQAAYANGSNPSTTPEIKLDTTRGTIDIQDADTTIGTDLLNIHGSNPTGLGTVLFGVSNTGRVTIQGTSDQSSAFQVLNASSDYLFNINSSNNYVFSNGISSPSNEIQNPGFETGGSVTGGEEGWFGTSQASIVNYDDPSEASDYELQITPNATNLDVYAGSYYNVRPGQNMHFEGYAKNSVGANGDAGIQITWYDDDESVVSSSTNYSGLPGTNYVLKALDVTVPAGAYYARVSATVRSTSNTGTFYFDNFYMKRSDEVASTTFRNSVDSTTAFQIQSAGSAQTLFTADTTNNILKVGDSTGTDTATTILVLDGTTADPTTLASKDGGLFYRSDTNSIKAVIGGAVVDVCTTAVTCSGYSAAAGSTVQLQGSTPGTAQTGNFNITGTGIMTQLQTQDLSSGSTNSSALTVRTGNATGSSSNSGNLTLDVGTATGSMGTISIGHTGVATTIGDTLTIQGANTLALGVASTNTGSILFNTSAGSHTIKLQAPGSNPTANWNLTLPQNPGSAGDCLKDASGTGSLGFSSCAAGITVNLQDVYTNSSSPATITLADGKDLKVVAQDTTTDPNIIFNLQCTTSCGSNGRFSVQNGGTDVFTVQPNNGGIILNSDVQIGSATTDATQVNLQLDSYNGSTDSGTCSATVNQGAMYYNSTMGSLRACLNGNWVDVSNPDTLGLLTFGIVPSTGSPPYDLPALVTTGVSGPCKVSRASPTSVTVQACVAYSSGQRVNVTSITLNTNSIATNNTNLTFAAPWGHICLTGVNNQPAFTSTAGLANALAGMPTFNVASPVLCLADVQAETSVNPGRIDNIYDTRTFTSTIKEAVNMYAPAELGMMVDSTSNGGLAPSASCTTGTCSGKLYGVMIATNGSTSAGAPNAIVGTVGPSWVKATSGTAGNFLKASSTVGYAADVASIPNNAFYYSPGNTRTTYSTTCTAANNCSGSMYVNFIVR